MTKTEPESAPADREPAQGWFEAGAHFLPVRVYYEDTDFSGIVYHANYLRFMERGRSDFLRLAGLRHQGMLKAEEPLVWAVRRIAIFYRRPARVDEALHVRTRVAGLVGARMNLDQAVLRAGEVLAEAQVEVCVITLDGRPRRVPDAIRRRLISFVGP